MSKPIVLTDELIASIQKEFIESVKKTKMFDGKLNYTKSFRWDGEDRATVVFSAVAFAKMTMLVQNFESEVAWHGVAYRDEAEKNKFYITDILVYPQLVSGATVETDQAAYQTWLYSHDDDVFNNIRMQGHSHVSFATNPSGVDTTHQEKILSQVDNTMFYIFMIWNKKFEKNIKIFDMANNTLYETSDIDVYIGEDGCDLEAFIKNAKGLVKSKTYRPQAGKQVGVSSGASGYQSGWQKGSPKAHESGSKSSSESRKSLPDIGSSGDGYDYGGFEDEHYSVYDYYSRYR